jgi:hypothetical protein
MPDHLHDASDSSADDAWVADLLRQNTDSLADTPEIPMPPEVWARLENALEAERVVVPLTSRASRGAHRGRWVAGVAAAAAVVVVGGLLVSNTSQDPAPVADAAVQQSAPEADAMVKSAAELPTSRILASGTRYSATSLGAQITSLFRDSLGVAKASDVDAMTQEPVKAMSGDDFMSDMGSLRTCVQTLAGTPSGHALVVDRGTFAGQPAGLIVISTWDHDLPSMVTPSALVTTPKGDLAVWVVDPTCTPVMNAEGASPLAVSVDW